MKHLFLFLSTFLLITSCDYKKQGKILPDSNGRINELLLVIDESDWKGEIGDEIRKIVTNPILGLPQPESQFDISQVNNKGFNSMFKAGRAILQVTLGGQNNFTIQKNKYASPQRIVSVSGKTQKDIIKILKDNKRKIANTFKELGITSIQKKIEKGYWDISKIKTFEKQGYSVKIPTTYKKVEDNGDFLWYRHRLGNNGNSMELVSYTVPITSEEDEKGNTIIKNRDYIGKKYLRGETEDSYAVTEEAYVPHLFSVTLAGKKAFETRGKWEIKGPYMAAGPFVNYTVIDKKRNRLIVLEGFVYAPAVKKRDYIFELEAIIKTLVVKE